MEALDKVHGKITSFTVPTGDIITIREQNGDDDDIISNSITANDGSSFNHFVTGIVVNSKRYGGLMSYKQVEKMPLRDKYCIIIQSRIFSLGSSIEFKFNWGTDMLSDIHSYEEDLKDFIWDYSKAMPETDSDEYIEERIAPYRSNASYMELELSSGKVIRLDYLNGVGEKYILELEDRDRTVNTPLKARSMSMLQLDGTYIKVESFKLFSSRDMMEIRTLVSKEDKEVTVLSELHHPHELEKIDYISIMMVPDFFFPVLR